MKKLLLMLWLLALLPAGAALVPDIAGDWQGTLHAGRDLRLVLTIARVGGGGLSGTLYSIDQSAAGLPVTAITLQGGALKFSLDPLRATFAGSLSADGNAIVGTFTQAGPLPLTFLRATEDSAWALPAPRRPQVPRSWTQAANVTPRFLTGSPGLTDYWPCFAPDGNTVLFSRRMDAKTWSFFTVPAGGGDARALLGTPLPVSQTRAAWSPRNNLIAFTGTSADGANTVWIMRGDGTGAHPLAPAGLSNDANYPSWYPAGERLAVMDARDLVIKRFDLTPGAAVAVTDHTQVLTGMPSVSPDGKWIAFAGQANTGQRYDQANNTIWLVGEEGVSHPAEAAPGQGRAPVWSPDGRRLAFESNRGSPDGTYAVFVMNRDGTGLTQVTDYALNANHPVWSVDGKRMVFSALAPGGRSAMGIAIIDFAQTP